MAHTEYDAAKHALAGGEQKEEKPVLHEIRIRRGHEKGFIAEHHHKTASGHHHPAVHEHPLANHKELLAHVAKHMPEEEAEGAEEKAGEQPGE